jgi:N-acetylglucosamine-6-phosphate deacetylase
MLEVHAVVVENEVIAAVVPEAELPDDIPTRALSGQLLAPGFIDAQVNGGNGVLFNEQPTLEGITTIARAHRQFGTTGLLPTLITDSEETTSSAISAVRHAIASGVPGVLGIHLEGPFLNPERKGVHDPQKIRLMDQDAVQLFASLDNGVILATLAPERIPPGLIEKLVAAGVIVAAGHTAASYEQIRTARIRGVSGFTHLYNAMTPLAGREPGVVGAALEDTDSWCGIIVDGHHVHPASLRIAIAAKPRGRVILVTDAMPTVGSTAKSFELGGETVTSVNGRCTTNGGTLAGSDLDMASAVRNTVRLLGLPLEEALRMAATYPAEILGMARQRGRLKPGLRADMVCLDEELRVLETWIGGSDSGVGSTHNKSRNVT